MSESMYKSVLELKLFSVIIKGNGYTFKGNNFQNCFVSFLERGLLLKKTISSKEEQNLFF